VNSASHELNQAVPRLGVHDNMKILTVVPTRIELNALKKAFQEQGYNVESVVIGKKQIAYIPSLETTVALGGLGKTQFALHTQQLIDLEHWGLVICAGTAGALVAGLGKGDVVISTETVEIVMPSKSDPPVLRRFHSQEGVLRQCRQAIQSEPAFRVLYGPIACGDEFVVKAEQRASIHKISGALVVAMEGAGGASASQVSGVPFIEIRAVTDYANIMAVLDFFLNLNKAMQNLAHVVISLACSSLEADRAE